MNWEEKSKNCPCRKDCNGWFGCEAKSIVHDGYQTYDYCKQENCLFAYWNGDKK